jgi:hypothetical protein
MSLLNAIQRENVDALQQYIVDYPNEINNVYETFDGEPYTMLDEVLRKIMMENRNEHSSLYQFAIRLMQQGAKTYDQVSSNVNTSYWRNNFPNANHSRMNQPTMSQPPVLAVAQQTRPGKPPLAPKRPKTNNTTAKRGIAFLPRTRRARRTRRSRRSSKH